MDKNLEEDNVVSMKDFVKKKKDRLAIEHGKLIVRAMKYAEEGKAGFHKKTLRAAHKIAAEHEKLGSHKIKETTFKDFYSGFLMESKRIEQLIPQMVEAAQRVYDEWDENEDEYAGGGVCHLIAEEISNVLSQNGIDAGSMSASVGEQHVFVIAKGDNGVYSVDISPYTYESGSGYSWQKKEGVQFSPDDIEVTKISHNPNDFEGMMQE